MSPEHNVSGMLHLGGGEGPPREPPPRISQVKLYQDGVSPLLE